jgi:PilZ domain
MPLLRKPLPHTAPAGVVDTSKDLLARLTVLQADQLVNILRGLDRKILAQALDQPQQVAEENSAAPEAPGSDSRRASRNRTLRAGKIIYNNKMCVTDCQIRDVSETGCRIRAASTSAIPRFFTLHVLAGDARHECEVVWRAKDELGIRYLA